MTLTEVLGWVLLHSLWQGAVAGALLSVALVAPRRHGAVTRYSAACTAMLLMAALPLLTGLRLVLDPKTFALDSDLLPRWRAAPWVGEWVRWFVPFWAAGVAVQAGRLWLGLARTRRLRGAGICAAPREWRATVDRIGKRLRIRGGATLRESVGLEKLQQKWPLAAVGAGGGSLLQRVRRLTVAPAAGRNIASVHWLSLGAAALAVLLIGSAQGARATPGVRHGPYGAKPQPPPVRSSAVIDEIAPEPLEAMLRFEAEHAWVLPGR